MSAALENAQPDGTAGERAVVVENTTGSGPFVLLCDHASNRIPPRWGALGLDEAALASHIAWDPGALEVTRHMSGMLDAPLVRSTLSRLIIDCNRPVDAPDAIPEISETTSVPGNKGLASEERQRRIALAHAPYHQTIEKLLDARTTPTILVAIHTYTPVYRGTARPWPIGIIFNRDRLLGEALIGSLQQKGYNVGINQPYSPADRVYYTLERHGEARGIACVMVEIRNDEVRSAAYQQVWAEQLAASLVHAAGSIRATSET